MEVVMATAPGSDVSSPLSPGDWKVDPAQSTLGFRTRAMGILPVKGSYSSFSGALHVDPTGAATGNLHVEAATITTGIKKRDNHLRSKDFFHVERHPQMTFDLTGLQGATDGNARLTGTLRIRDHDLPLDTLVTLTAAGSNRLQINGTFKIDHRAAGFEFKRLPRNVEIDASLTLEPVS
jgi:polyisoprenoid-binding protein YceI